MTGDVDRTPEDDRRLLPCCSELPCSRAATLLLPDSNAPVCVGHYVAIVTFMSEEVAPC